MSKAKKPKKESTKDPCAKFDMQAAAAAGTGAIVGAFTFGIGTLAGSMAAVALANKGKKCRADIAKKRQEEAAKAEQLAMKEEQKKEASLAQVQRPATSVSPSSVSSPVSRALVNIQTKPDLRTAATAGVAILAAIYLLRK